MDPTILAGWASARVAVRSRSSILRRQLATVPAAAAVSEIFRAARAYRVPIVAGTTARRENAPSCVALA
jgi:hypothetical protein